MFVGQLLRFKRSQRIRRRNRGFRFSSALAFWLEATVEDMEGRRPFLSTAHNVMSSYVCV